MKKLILVVFVLTSIFSFGQVKPTNPEFKIEQAPYNKTWGFNNTDTTQWGYSSWSGWQKFFTAKTVQHKIDSIANASEYLKLDQTVPDTVINGVPVFNEGIKFGLNPNVPSFDEGLMFFDSIHKTISVMVGDDITIQLAQEEVTLVYNNTGAVIGNGKVVYPTGVFNGNPTIALAKADVEASSFILGVTTESIPIGGTGFVTSRGKVHDMDTHLFSSAGILYLSATTAGELTNIEPTEVTEFSIKIGVTLEVDATEGSIYVRPILNNKLTDLSDVKIVSPAVDEVLRWNGEQWINGTQTNVSPGSGVAFYLDDTEIIPASTQSIPLHTLSKVPIITAEVIDSRTVNNSTILLDRYMYNTPLGGTQIDAGIWTYNTYCYVSSASNYSYIPVTMRKVTTGTGTATITGTGTSRTFTVTGGTPFVAGDVNADVTLSGLVQTSNAIFRIIGFTSSSVVTVETLSTYTNQSGVAYYPHKFLFVDNNVEINNVSVGLVSVQSAQPAFTIDPTDRLACSYYASTNAPSNRTLYLYHNGTDNYSHFLTPLIARHNDLSGIQGGVAAERYHLDLAQKTIATQPASGSVAGYVTTTAQTIAGVKTFSSSPIVPTPTTGTQAANKTYVDTKVTSNTAITGATKTKITYDSKGLVTSGTDATATDIVNTPTGNIAATNVQAAINELDSEKEGIVTKGNLTESVTGLQFSQSRQVIGGSTDLSLSSGYVIPLATDTARWASEGYKTRYEIIVAVDGETTYTIPFELREKTMVFYNGNLLRSSVWNGIGTPYLTISGNVLIKDVITIQN